MITSPERFIVPSLLGLSPDNTSEIKYVYIDFPKKMISFQRHFEPKEILESVSDVIPAYHLYYTAITSDISIGRLHISNKDINAIMDTGTSGILLPKTLFEALVTYLSQYTGIPSGNEIWKGAVTKLPQFLRDKFQSIMPITFKFRTKKGGVLNLDLHSIHPL